MHVYDTGSFHTCENSCYHFPLTQTMWKTVVIAKSGSCCLFQGSDQQWFKSIQPHEKPFSTSINEKYHGLKFILQWLTSVPY